MQQKNFVKDKLTAGTPVLGVWSIINSAIVTEIMATAGLDFQILDLEHGAFDVPSLDASIRACEAAGCSPFVRVAGLHPTSIQTALDLGAHGIVVPQVQGAADAARAVEAAKFAPEGTRGYNPFTRAGAYLGGIGDTPPKLRNDFALTAVILENRRSYDELDQILAIGGLDMIYLGTYDMSVVLGCMGEMNNPKLLEFVESSTRRIKQAGKFVGLMVGSREQIDRYLGLGADVFLYMVDTFLLSNAVHSAVQAFSDAKDARK